MPPFQHLAFSILNCQTWTEIGYACVVYGFLAITLIRCIFGPT